jgi:hypothetical protein
LKAKERFGEFKIGSTKSGKKKNKTRRGRDKKKEILLP